MDARESHDVRRVVLDEARDATTVEAEVGHRYRVSVPSEGRGDILDAERLGLKERRQTEIDGA
jgi:hypothetical protein